MREQIQKSSYNELTSAGVMGTVKIVPQPRLVSYTKYSNIAHISFVGLIFVLLAQPIQAYTFISLDRIILAEQVRLWSSLISDQSDANTTNAIGSNLNTNSTLQNRIQFPPSNLTKEEKTQKQQFEPMNTKYSRKYHTFVYPYVVYEVQNLTLEELHKIMAMTNDQTPEDKDDLNETAYRNHSSAVSVGLNSSFIIPQMFLLQKINSCTSYHTCLYLSILPNNVAFATENINEKLYFFKIGQSEFVIENVIVSNLNSSQGEKPNGHKASSIFRSQIHFFTLNLNIFLFSKINEQRESIGVGFSKLFRKSKIFQVMSDENASWDVAYNGSSFRFVKLTKVKISKEQLYDNQQIKKANERKQLQNQQKMEKQISAGQETRITNIIHMVQHSIMMYQDNKHYFVKFYSSQQINQREILKVESHSSKRNEMVGVTRNNSYFLFFSHFTFQNSMVRIFYSDLHRLELMEQVITSNTGMGNKTGIRKVDLQGELDLNLQLHQGQPKLKQQKQNEKLYDWGDPSTVELRDCTGNQTEQQNTTWCSGLNGLEKQVFLQNKAYYDKQRFTYLYASRLLESKLKTILRQVQNESVEEQQSNCHLVWNVPTQMKINSSDLMHLNKYLSGISFNKSNKITSATSKEWSVCRIAIGTGHQNLVIQPTTFQAPLSHPYLLFRCSLYNSALSKCYYHEWTGAESSGLPQNSKSVLFIVNQGQTYDLVIRDITSAEMDKIAQSFLLIFISLCAVACIFMCSILCRPAYLILCIRLGLAIPQTEASFRYPLNCLQLRYKLYSLTSAGVIKWSDGQAKEDDDDCIFCLSPKSQDALVEVYCFHTYHRGCFEEWVKQQRTQLSCPICKRRLNSQGLLAYQEQTELIL